MNETKRGNVLKKLKGSKKFMFLFAFGLIVLVSTGVYAVYILSHQSTTTYTIQGGISDFGVVADLSPFTFNVNNESLTNTQQITLQNDNSDILLNYDLNVSITNLDPINCDEVGDVSFLLEENSTEILDGSNFTISAGETTYDFTVSVISDKACPSVVDVSLDFTE